MNAMITWRSCADELPDDEATVLLHLDDDEVWTGFRDGDDWRYLSADLVSQPVLHWAHFPEPPK